MIKIELEQWKVKALRNYFGLNDKSSLEHWAYDVFNKALKEQLLIQRVSNTEGGLVCDCGSTNVSFTKYLFFKCHDCKNEWDEAN